MNQKKPGVTVFAIFIICVLGTIPRIWYAYQFEPWTQAPDQLAWELGLTQAVADKQISYSQLIWYPHEGGTILISLVSLVIKLFTNFPSLVISALLLDFISRWLQLYIVSKIFSQKVFWAFAVWTIFTLPSLLVWSSVNFGLHALSACFPFLLLLLVHYRKDTVQYLLICGVLMGLAIWFSYINIVLLPVLLICLFFHVKQYKNWLYFLAGISGILFLHILVRNYADAGFHLSSYSQTSIRGVDLTIHSTEQYKNLYSVWNKPLAGSSLLPAFGKISLSGMRTIWICLVWLGLSIFMYMTFVKKIPQIQFLTSLVMLCFLSLYALSPFYHPYINGGHFVSYRHLAYILPFLSLFVLVGYSYHRYAYIFAGFFLLVSLVGFLETMMTNAEKKAFPEAIGWVLATKFGHDSEKLQQLINMTEKDREKICTGIGWGITANLFQEVSAEQSELIQKQIDRISKAYQQIPAIQKENFKKGVAFAFNEGITPVLDKRLLDKILTELN